MQIVLFSDDINLLSYWENICGKNNIVLETMEELLEIKKSIIIANYSAYDNNSIQIILELKKSGNSVLVLHRTPNINLGKQLLSFGANGYGNALMKAHFLLSAIDAIKEGLVWLHPEFTSSLINEIAEKESNNIDSLISVLSEKEKEVVMFLKDGDTYKVIALKLNITPRTVKAHASSIYTKLNVKDRLSLALLLK